MLGPLDLNVGMAHMAQHRKEEQAHKQMEEKINCIAAGLQSNKEESPGVGVGDIFAPMDVDDIQNECEALLQLMENEGFEPPPADFKTIPKIKHEDGVEAKLFEMKTEKIVIDDVVELYTNTGVIKQEDFMESNTDFNVKVSHWYFFYFFLFNLPFI